MPSSLRQLVLVLLIFSGSHAMGQQDVNPVDFDYSRADSIALSFPKKKYKSYTELVSPLISDLHTDHEKLRVLFRWISDNISYNYGNRSCDADKVVKSGKAVCIGYSTLFKEMCNSAGIECEIIVGYSKTKITDINKKLRKTDHAWNAVKLYGKWYLLDVTWAAGYYDDRKRKNVKSFNELYYLTDPEIFVRKHYPKEKKWQLLEKPIRKSEFIKAPVYYSAYFENRIRDLKPEKGIIKIRVRDILEIKFKSDRMIKSAVIELGKGQFVFLPEIESAGDSYLIRQKFDKPGSYELNLFLNGSAVVSYRIEIKE
jgi:hypothetical protein